MPGVLRLVALCSLFAIRPAIAATVAFDAADVHASPERLHPEMHGTFRGDRISLRDATLADLIAISYNVDDADVVGGPGWIAFDRFDINAKAPAGTSEAAGREMLQSLLADRFKLIVRTEKRPLPAFVLTPGKSPKLKQADASTEGTGCQYQQQSSQTTEGDPQVHFSCHNVTMESFSVFLHDVASPYLTRPVIDNTGLKGSWDFDLQWSYRKPSAGGGTTIFEAIDKQLGLKLEQKTTPTPVVVIDSVNEKPTPNIAGLEKILPPPPPAEFEVATVRPAAPEEKNFNIEIRGNRVNVRFATLLTLIYKSFDVNPNSIESRPKWIDDVHWDVMGEVASASASSQIPGAHRDVDYEDVKEMLRSLLAERFKLATHEGSQPSPVYALIAAGPKMKKADPANHPTCIEGPLPGAKDPRIDNPLLNRLISCQNMSMTQFATELHALAGGYLPAPVIDATGLENGYDFTVSFSKKNNLRNAAAPSAAGDLTQASLPTDSGGIALSLFDAVQKQLGLKLEMRNNVPMPTLVIDHLEERPTEN